MKYYIAFLLLFLSHKAWVRSDTIHVFRFQNGKISTLSVMLDDREGYAKAFDLTGNEIYSEAIRRYGGHSGVTFSHHANGCLMKAEYSSQPDGGIQYYRKYTYFDDKGKKTSEMIDDWDNRVTVPKFYFQDTTSVIPVVPVIPQKKEEKPKPKPIVQEPMPCASIHKNRVEFLNHSKHKLLLSISQQGKDTIIVLKPGERHECPAYISAEIASPFNQNVRYQFNCQKKKCEVDSTTKMMSVTKDETLHTVNFYGKSRRLKH